MFSNNACVQLHTFSFLLLVLLSKNTESTFFARNSTNLSNNENGGNDIQDQKEQTNSLRIIYEITKFKAKDFIDITSEHKPDIVYTVINGNVHGDICWSEFDETDGKVLDLECGLLYGITALSLMFRLDTLHAIENLQTSPMTNNTIVDLMTNHNSLMHSLILHVKANTRDEEQSICYCESTNDFLSEYLTETLKVVGSQIQKSSSSVKLGLEYNEDLIDCCTSQPFDLLRFVDFVVMRLEISPLNHIFSYGLISEWLDNMLRKNRKFVHGVNSNCTIYTRVVFKENVFTAEIDDRFKALIAKYVNAWTEENKDDEIFIIDIISYSLDINISSNFDFLHNHVSPIFYGFHTPGTLPLISDKCHENPFHCTNKYSLALMSQTFHNIVFSKHRWNTFCSILSNCPLDLNRSVTSTNFLSTSVVFTFYKDTNEQYQVFTRKLAENAQYLNIRTIHFFHQYSSWNTSEWESTVYILRSKNIKIGCYVIFSKSIYLSDTILINDIKERCGPLLYVSSDVLCEWQVNAALKGILPKFLVFLDHLMQVFSKYFPAIKIIPSITLEGKKETNNQKRSSTNSGKEVSSIYCNPNEERLNEFYNGVLTFASIHGWDNLHLRPAIIDGIMTGWWDNIETDENYINRSHTDFPVLVHTNAAKQFLDAHEQLPMTFPCIVWTEKSLELGIPFLENKYFGTTIDMALRNDVILKTGELETLMLFAFGKFPCVELAVKSKLDLDVVTEVLTERFLNALRRESGTGNLMIYLEMPVAFNFETLHLYHLSDDMGINLAGWENNDDMKKFNTVTMDAKTILGLSVIDCGHEISLNFSRFIRIPFVSRINYIVCNVKPVLPNNFNQVWMQKYLNTLFYIKRYTETFLPRYATMKGNFEVYFRLNFDQEANCQESTKQSVEAFLRFLSDVNQHSYGYKIRIFIKAFEYQKVNDACSKSWWRLKSYDDLTNTSLYTDREEEHFGRTTKLTLQIPAVDVQTAEMSNNVIIVVVISAVSVFLIGAIIAMWINLQRMRKRYLTEKEMNEFYNGELKDTTDNSNWSNNEWLGMPFPKTFEIPKSSIEMGRLIGSGEFGDVFVGVLNKEAEVAIKVPKPNESKEIISGALTEVKVLCHVSCGEHPNVILFLGAYTREILRGKLYIVTEYCKNGSLQSYLRKRQAQCSNTTTHCTIDLYELYKFAYEIASGMDYISGKKVVHGDLSARNVFLNADLTCKIGDFGLSRKLYEYTEYVKKSQEPLPWRWMAIESLKSMEFTTKSDVWSYGVTLWEIFTLGVLPYPGLSWNTNFVNDLESGMRMEKAKYATDSIHGKMLSCWILHAKERPTFIEMMEFFAELRRNEYTKL